MQMLFKALAHQNFGRIIKLTKKNPPLALARNEKGNLFFQLSQSIHPQAFPTLCTIFEQHPWQKIEQKNAALMTILRSAFKKKEPKEMQHFFEKHQHSLMEATRAYGHTPLSLALILENLEYLTHFMAQHPPWLREKDAKGRPPLELALCLKNYTGMCRILEKYPLLADEPNSQKHSLFFEIEKKKPIPKNILFVLYAKYPFGQKNKEKKALVLRRLLQSTFEEDADLFMKSFYQNFLEKKPDEFHHFFREEKKGNPLHYALFCKAHRIFPYLYTLNPKWAYEKNQGGHTPIHQAWASKKIDFLSFLLNSNPLLARQKDAHQKNIFDKIKQAIPAPLHLMSLLYQTYPFGDARKKSEWLSTIIKKALLASKALPHSLYCGDTKNLLARLDAITGGLPMHFAIEANDLNLFKFLLKKAPKYITKADEKKQMPLHFALHASPRIVAYIASENPHLFSLKNSKKKNAFEHLLEDPHPPIETLLCIYKKHPWKQKGARVMWALFILYAAHQGKNAWAIKHFQKREKETFWLDLHQAAKIVRAPSPFYILIHWKDPHLFTQLAQYKAPYPSRKPFFNNHHLVDYTIQKDTPHILGFLYGQEKNKKKREKLIDHILERIDDGTLKEDILCTFKGISGRLILFDFGNHLWERAQRRFKKAGDLKKTWKTLNTLMKIPLPITLPPYDWLSPMPQNPRYHDDLFSEKKWEKIGEDIREQKKNFYALDFTPISKAEKAILYNFHDHINQVRQKTIPMNYLGEHMPGLPLPLVFLIAYFFDGKGW